MSRVCDFSNLTSESEYVRVRQLVCLDLSVTPQRHRVEIRRIDIVKGQLLKSKRFLFCETETFMDVLYFLFRVVEMHKLYGSENTN